MNARTGHCDNAREWASLELDGELSSFEHVLLESHLRSCKPCVEFREGIRALTEPIRSAAPSVPERRVVGPRRAWRVPRVRVTAVAAAAAVAFGAFGLASSVSETPGGPDPFNPPPRVPRDRDPELKRQFTTQMLNPERPAISNFRRFHGIE
jgi:hypothetical protein